MTKNNTLFLIIGIALIFLSLYLFTKPAFYGSWDFSNTGQIGDTIGGVTAPIINLIGAFLVYISFQEQLNANRIQVKAMDDERARNTYDRELNNYNSLYISVKVHLENLEFVVLPKPNYGLDGSITSVNHIVYKGLNALNEFVIRIENKYKYKEENYEIYGILLSFQFILKSLSELSNLVESNIILRKDKAFLSQNIRLMYESFLKSFADRIIKAYSEDETYIKNLIKIKEELDIKFFVENHT